VKRAAVITGSGVFIDGSLCVPLWRHLQTDLTKLQRDGGRVRPEIVECIEVLRAASINHLQANPIGPSDTTSSDIVTLLKSEEETISTRDLADTLKVSPRHTLRLIEEVGINPVCPRPYRWATTDVALLIADHRRAQRR
jgi:hypothetical protein